MANIDGTSGGTGLYNTQIPDLSDSADIQDALRLYHYGSTTPPTSEAGIVADSIAGYIKELNQQISELTPAVVQQLNADENLNNIILDGIYSQNSDTDARTTNSLNYPLFPDANGQAFAGLLIVRQVESIVYQTYQMSGNQNHLFIRSRTGSTWTGWKRYSESDHIHDDRYYTETEVNTLLGQKQNTVAGAAETIMSTNLTASRALASNLEGKVAVSDTSLATLNLLSGTTATTGKSGNANLVFSDSPAFSNAPTAPTQASRNNSTRIATTEFVMRDAITSKSAGVSSAGIFIQSAQPSSASVNDLWIW